MRGADRLQKILYLIMLVLGIYIIYKGGSILLDTPAAQEMLDSGNVQRALEDSAVRTWTPGYAAVVENYKKDNWISGWMRQTVPVYSYLTGGQAVTEEEPESMESFQKQPGTKASAGDGKETEDTLAEGEKGDTETEKRKEASRTEETVPGGGDVREDERTANTEKAAPAVSTALLNRLEDFDYLISNYFTVDIGTVADENLLDAASLLGEDLTLQKNFEVPQILIYHTHSQEAFADSREGKTEDTIVGMGETLAEILRETYGYNVIHDTGVYDLVDGVLDRSTAYDYARASVEKILQENPTIEVVIDLHRDGVEGQKFVTEIDGKPTSMIMFFNGISRDSQDRPITYLQNPYTEQNLAFSLQLQLAAQKKYPGFTRNIYLKAERFNLHLRPRSLLIEAGTQLNTVEEERNAMTPLADLLNHVLEGK